MPEHSPELLTLVAAAQLRDISYLELVCRRHELSSDEEAATQDEEVEPKYRLNVDIHDSGTRFRLRLGIELAPIAGAISVEVGGDYEVVGDEPPLLEQVLLVEYANEVGVMQLLPYLRQAIADLTQRVFGAALIMPVLPRGAVRFEVTEP